LSDKLDRYNELLSALDALQNGIDTAETALREKNTRLLSAAKAHYGPDLTDSPFPRSPFPRSPFLPFALYPFTFYPFSFVPFLPFGPVARILATTSAKYARSTERPPH
jgi:hypothetical protein